MVGGELCDIPRLRETSPSFCFSNCVLCYASVCYLQHQLRSMALLWIRIVHVDQACQAFSVLIILICRFRTRQTNEIRSKTTCPAQDRSLCCSRRLAFTSRCYLKRRSECIMNHLILRGRGLKSVRYSETVPTSAASEARSGGGLLPREIHVYPKLTVGFACFVLMMQALL